MSAFTTTIMDSDGNDVPVVVEYTYHRACRGQRDSLGGVRGAGPLLEPDESASIEIVSVKDAVGEEVILSGRQYDAIQEAVWGHLQDAAANAAEAAAESREDQRREDAKDSLS